MDRTQLISNVRSNLAGLGRGSLGVPVLLLAMLAMMTLPIPPFLLDVLFTFNIALSIVVLLVCVYALRRWTSPCSRPSCWWRPCCAWR